MDTTEMISLRDAAQGLAVHYMTAYRYVRTGALPASRRDGRWWIRPEDLTTFIADRAASSGRPGRPPGEAGSPDLESLSSRMADALADRLVAGDQGGAWEIVAAALDAGAGLARINASLLTPALARIGTRWEQGDIRVGDEHRATVVAHRLIARLGRRFTRPGRRSGAVVVTAMAEDRHGLPSAIVADLLRAEGLEAVDLGADTPIADLVHVATTQDRLVAVGICATTRLEPHRAEALVSAVDELRAATERPVLIGGSAVTGAIAERAGADHHSVDADDALAWFLRVAGAEPTG